MSKIFLWGFNSVTNKTLRVCACSDFILTKIGQNFLATLYMSVIFLYLCSPIKFNSNKKKFMKIIRLLLLVLVTMTVCSASAKKYPEIKFEKTTIDFGVFSQDDPVQKCVFKFTNTGKGKLVINYVHASCGCTVAEFPKDFISPGASGEIVVTYNGTGRMPGRFKKHVQVFTNCKNDLTRIFIQGEMSALKKDVLDKKQSK